MSHNMHKTAYVQQQDISIGSSDCSSFISKEPMETDTPSLVCPQTYMSAQNFCKADILIYEGIGVEAFGKEFLSENTMKTSISVSAPSISSIKDNYNKTCNLQHDKKCKFCEPFAYIYPSMSYRETILLLPQYNNMVRDVENVQNEKVSVILLPNLNNRIVKKLKSFSISHSIFYSSAAISWSERHWYCCIWERKQISIFKL